jgi:aspartate dehydrogenase
MRVTLIGYGAIGAGVCDLLDADPTVMISAIVVPDVAQSRSREPNANRHFVSAVDLTADRPDLLIECAGHSAIEQHVIPALEAGIPSLIVSVGALSAEGLVERLEQAAQQGGTFVQLLPGAIGAIDALAAAKIGGLDSVIYEGRKPPCAWKGTPAEAEFSLDTLSEAVCIFRGSAREASSLFPKNANVAATVALSGIGLDKTQVALFADPSVIENQHHIEASGAFGSFELTLRGKPLAANPKTSALTVYSVVRALTNRSHALSI